MRALAGVPTPASRLRRRSARGLRQGPTIGDGYRHASGGSSAGAGARGGHRRGARICLHFHVQPVRAVRRRGLLHGDRAASAGRPPAVRRRAGALRALLLSEPLADLRHAPGAAGHRCRPLDHHRSLAAVRSAARGGHVQTVAQTRWPVVADHDRLRGHGASTEHRGPRARPPPGIGSVANRRCVSARDVRRAGTEESRMRASRRRGRRIASRQDQRRRVLRRRDGRGPRVARPHGWLVAPGTAGIDRRHRPAVRAVAAGRGPALGRRVLRRDYGRNRLGLDRGVPNRTRRALYAPRRVPLSGRDAVCDGRHRAS